MKSSDLKEFLRILKDFKGFRDILMDLNGFKDDAAMREASRCLSSEYIRSFIFMDFFSIILYFFTFIGWLIYFWFILTKLETIFFIPQHTPQMSTDESVQEDI